MAGRFEIEEEYVVDNSECLCLLFIIIFGSSIALASGAAFVNSFEGHPKTFEINNNPWGIDVTGGVNYDDSES
ncbi:MAG: hypothetical protein RLN62_05495 [Rickettsiales bacterium]